MIGWQERLAVLRDLGRWEHALLLALTLLEAAQVRWFILFYIISLHSRQCMSTRLYKAKFKRTFSLDEAAP